MKPFEPLGVRVQRLLQIAKYRLATNAPDRAAIYKLRYSSYLRESAIKPSAEELLTDRYDEAENTRIFAIEINSSVVASIRIHVLSRTSYLSPTMEAFSDLLMPLIESGACVIDPTRFVVSSEAQKKWPELAYVTLRIPVLAAGYFSAQYVAASVRQEHMAFYKKFLRCRQVALPRPYLQLSKPLALMLVDYSTENAAAVKAHAFFAPSHGEPQSIFDEPPIAFSAEPTARCVE